MALNKNFYKEIYENETMWIDMINSKLINAYYLIEIKEFYQKKQIILNAEFELTGNNMMKNISYAINNIIVKLDFFINEDKKGKIIRLRELNNLFLVNVLNNNLPPINKKTVNQINHDKKSLYELRNKIIGEDNEDYIDDDFYYNSQKVA